MASDTDIPDTSDIGMHTDEMLINMGPQHPSTHGVLRLVLCTDGELIRHLQPHVGYLHRCAEKIAENVTPLQFIPYTDRLDYLAAMNMNLGYALAVEKLCGIEVPERATVLRVLVSELNRIASHLMSFGAYGLDLGAFTPMMYAFREREMICNLFEALCGARLTYSYVTIGGVTHDIPEEAWITRCREFLDYFEPRIKDYNALLTDNHIFIQRTANVGILSPAMAIAYGVTGPSLRGSGVVRDLRKDEAYCGYDTYDFDVCVGPGGPGTVGDSWNRYYVRILEFIESIKIVRQALDRLQEGEIQTKLKRVLKLAEGEAYVETEAPRGQMGFFVVGDGSPVPHRVKIRSACFCNLSVMNALCRDIMLADIPAILGSIDVVMGDVDR